jgi:hypothetical protein
MLDAVTLVVATTPKHGEALVTGCSCAGTPSFALEDIVGGNNFEELAASEIHVTQQHVASERTSVVCSDLFYQAPDNSLTTSNERHAANNKFRFEDGREQDLDESGRRTVLA